MGLLPVAPAPRLFCYAREFMASGLGQGGIKSFMLRTNITNWDAKQLWRICIQLSQTEAAFCVHRSELSMRPIWHQRADQVQ